MEKKPRSHSFRLVPQVHQRRVRTFVTPLESRDHRGAHLISSQKKPFRHSSPCTGSQPHAQYESPRNRGPDQAGGWENGYVGGSQDCSRTHSFGCSFQPGPCRRSPVRAGKRVQRMDLPSFIVTRAVYTGLLDRVKRFINRRRDLGYSNPTEFIKEAICRYLNELESAEKLSFRKEPE